MQISDANRQTHQDCCQIAKTDGVHQTRPLENMATRHEPRLISTFVTGVRWCCLGAKYLRFVIVVIVIIHIFIDSRRETT